MRGHDLGSPLYVQLDHGDASPETLTGSLLQRIYAQIAWGCGLGFSSRGCCAEVEDGCREAGLQSPGVPSPTPTPLPIKPVFAMK